MRLLIAGIIIFFTSFYFYLIWPRLSHKQQIRPFLHTMFAHRGYHCIEKGIPENSLSSFRAAKNSRIILILYSAPRKSKGFLLKSRLFCRFSTICWIFFKPNAEFRTPRTQRLYAGRFLRLKRVQTRCALPGSTGVSACTEHQVLIPSVILPSRREIFWPSSTQVSPFFTTGWPR